MMNYKCLYLNEIDFPKMKKIKISIRYTLKLNQLSDT